MHESLRHFDRQPRRFRATFSAFPSHLEQLEAERALCRLSLRQERRKRFWQAIGRMWPVGLGIVLGFAAPQLHAVVNRFEPWGLWLVFPFAVLACRPELQVVVQLVNHLPTVLLYLQFPLEGLIAILALQRRVTVAGVAAQFLYLHYLAGLQLLMIGGAVTQALVR
jgi:hypothetical protein